MATHQSHVALRAKLEELLALRHAGVITTDDELISVRRHVIASFVSKPAPPPGDRQEVANEGNTLAAVFAAQEARRLEPWRVHRDLALKEKELMVASDIDATKSLYLDLVKAQQICPSDALVLNHLLYGGEEGKKHLIGILLRKAGNARYAAANLGSARNEAFWGLNGQTVVSLPLPLFPDTPEFSALNQRLLVEWGAPEGGASQDSTRARQASTIFKTDSATFHNAPPPMGGEPFLPVVDTPEGLQADGALVKGVIDDIYARLESLNKYRGRGAPPTYRGTRSRGRAMYRGRGGYGRGGGKYQGGEEPPAYEPAAPKTDNRGSNF